DGIRSSIAPARFISSRTTFSTLRRTRSPSGDQVYRPEASRRIMPARSISLWLAISASAGISLTVARWNWLRRMRVDPAWGKTPIIAVRLLWKPPGSVNAGFAPARLKGGRMATKRNSFRLAILLVLRFVRSDLLLALGIVERGRFSVLLHHHRGVALEHLQIRLQGVAKRLAVGGRIGDRLAGSRCGLCPGGHRRWCLGGLHWRRGGFDRFHLFEIDAGGRRSLRVMHGAMAVGPFVDLGHGQRRQQHQRHGDQRTLHGVPLG